MFKVLVVDDDAGLRYSVASALSEGHFQVEQAEDGEDALNKVQSGSFDLVLMDVNMPKMSGLESLKEMKAHDPSIVVIMMTAFSNIKDAVTATKEGAYNYLEKPIKAENLVYMIDQALKARKMVSSVSLSAPVIQLPGGGKFVGQSREMKKVFDVIDKLSRVDTAVLIRGESGTGKELVAKSLHFSGPRKDNRFVTVNCSAIPENLIESEFFGHEKGAFTGADSRKIGKFQYADGGTLFLDEIGDISSAMQVKLLRALQEKKFTPVGSNREIEVDVRIVAASNRPFEKMIQEGTFREDLFYRLNVLPIKLPPLRERRNDIDHLLEYFVARFNEEYSKSIRGLSDDTLEILRSHSWPGNIRELENVIEHAFVLESSDMLTRNSLPESLTQSAQALFQEIQRERSGLSEEERAGSATLQKGSVPADASGKGFRLDIQKLDFQANKEEFEKQFLISALKAFNGRINQTALHANIPKKTLLRKLEKYQINAKDYARH